MEGVIFELAFIGGILFSIWFMLLSWHWQWKQERDRRKERENIPIRDENLTSE